MTLDYKTLKAHHRKRRDTLPVNVNLRVHRALSWLQAADEAEQPDAKFIFLWIAFNSVYAQELDSDVTFTEKGLFRDFICKLMRLDPSDRMYNIIWQNYSGKIRIFINNPYVSRCFWDFHNGRLTEEEWRRKFDRSCRDAAQALIQKDTVAFTGISKVNRAQVRDGSRILEQIVPVIIHLVMENPDEEWGAPCFPPVESSSGY